MSIRRQAELDAMITHWTTSFEREELGALLDSHGVPRGDI
jgi:formyl-CoA transferase